MVSEAHTTGVMQSGYVFGIACGIFVTTSIFFLLFALYSLLVNKKRHTATVLLYGSVSTFTFALFHVFVVHLHSPIINTFIPEWVYLLGIVCMPFGVYFNFLMILHSIPIKTLKGYLAWQWAKRFYPIYYPLIFIYLLLTFFLINNQYYIVSMAFAFNTFNNIYSIYIARNALDSTIFRRLHNPLLTFVAVLSSIAIYLGLFVDFTKLSITWFIFLHLLYALANLIYSFVILRFLIDEVEPLEDISKFDVDGFYKSVYQALNNDEFFLVYQPKIALNSKQVMGVEALIRWQHPKKGLISPIDFIPKAEETGMINPLSQWVISQVAKDIKVLYEQGIDIPVSINFSVHNIHPSMGQYLIKTLTTHGLSMSAIILEITETSLLDLTSEKKQTLKMLKQAGIRLSLDDFGAGYSSLRHIDELELSEVKIDRELVDKLQDDSRVTVIHTIVNMCHELNIQVVAEGVNGSKVSKQLMGIGCEMAQGFGICKPQNLQEIMQWISNQERS